MTPPKPPRMRYFRDGYSWAVFNAHDEDFSAAKKAYVSKFGEESFKQVIGPILKKGIMSIFSETPSEETVYYTYTLAMISDLRAHEASKAAVSR